MQIREQHTVEIDGDNYIITAFEATYGLNVLAQLQNMAEKGEAPSGLFMKDVIMKSVTVNNVQFTDASFNIHFSRKYKKLYKLFEEISKFNFGDLTDPNEQGDISE